MDKLSHIVTGAAGLVGFDLTRSLLARGDRVIGTDNFLKGGEQDIQALQEEYPDTFDFVKGDLADPGLLKELDGEYDTIFHMAAIVGVAYVNDHPYETMRVNMLSTLNVTDFAIRNSCKGVVFASSSENYASAVTNGWIGLPTGEDVPLCITDIELPRWSYASSKTAGESAIFGAARIGDFTPYVVRFHNVYGPRMNPTHVIPEFIQRCVKRMDPFPVYGYDATRSYLHVRDAVEALALIAFSEKSTEGGIFNVGSPEELSIEQLLEVVFECADFRPNIDKHPAPPGSVKRRIPDISKLESLGFQPKIGLREGIQECLVSGLERASC